MKPARTELLAALRKAPKALKSFETMPPSHQERWIGFVAEAKKPETRAKRIERCLRDLDRWTGQGSSAGYSGTPLPQKLGIKEGHRVAFPGAPENFPKTLGPLPSGVTIAKDDLDVVVQFVREMRNLEELLPPSARRIKPNGGLWIAWPKKASGVETDLTENRIRDLALAAGLVDNKVCAIDETWSGLRLVYRLKDRPRA